MNKITPLIFLFALLIFGCNKESEDPAAKDVGFFDEVSVNGSAKITLVPGAENKVLSTNISDIMYSASNGKLTVNGNGRMEIAISDLESFFCNGCDLECEETLILDSTSIDIHAGSASFSNLIVSQFIEISLVNSGSYEFSGSAIKADVSITNNPIFKGYNFECDTMIINSGHNDAQVNVKDFLDAHVGGTGDIIYKGNPDSLDISGEGTGKGQVIPF